MKTEQELRQLHGSDYVQAFAGMNTARLERLLDHVRLAPADVVADFGCGDGQLMKLIAHKVGSYSGVDFSPEFIVAAQKRKEEIAAVNVDLFNQDIIDFCAQRPGKFTAAFALDISEHVYDETWLTMLKSIHSSLLPGEGGAILPSHPER